MMWLAIVMVPSNIALHARSQLFTGGGGGEGCLPISLVHHLRAQSAQAREWSKWGSEVTERGEGVVPPPTRGSFCNFYTKMEWSGAYLRWDSCNFFAPGWEGGGGGDIQSRNIWWWGRILGLITRDPVYLEHRDFSFQRVGGGGGRYFVYLFIFVYLSKIIHVFIHFFLIYLFIFIPECSICEAALLVWETSECTNDLHPVTRLINQ